MCVCVSVCVYYIIYIYYIIYVCVCVYTCIYIGAAMTTTRLKLSLFCQCSRSLLEL